MPAAPDALNREIAQEEVQDRHVILSRDDLFTAFRRKAQRPTGRLSMEHLQAIFETLRERVATILLPNSVAQANMVLTPNGKNTG
jgi:hypothetical protein